MASGLRSGDQASHSPPGPSTSPAPLRHATSLTSKSVRSSQRRASNSEKAPLLPRIAKAPERVSESQKRGNYGTIQDGGKAKIPDYEIPIWQVIVSKKSCVYLNLKFLVSPAIFLSTWVTDYNLC